MHYAPGWGGNGDKNSTPTELFWAGTKLGHPQKPQVFQFCSGPVYFCLRIVTAQNKYFYGILKVENTKPSRDSVPLVYDLAVPGGGHQKKVRRSERETLPPILESEEHKKHTPRKFSLPCVDNEK